MNFAVYRATYPWDTIPGIRVGTASCAILGRRATVYILVIGLEIGDGRERSSQ